MPADDSSLVLLLAVVAREELDSLCDLSPSSDTSDPDPELELEPELEPEPEAGIEMETVPGGKLGPG